jgi:hypothetical protein
MQRSKADGWERLEARFKSRPRPVKTRSPWRSIETTIMLLVIVGYLGNVIFRIYAVLR